MGMGMLRGKELGRSRLLQEEDLGDEPTRGEVKMDRSERKEQDKEMACTDDENKG